MAATELSTGLRVLTQALGDWEKIPQLTLGEVQIAVTASELTSEVTLKGQVLPGRTAAQQITDMVNYLHPGTTRNDPDVPLVPSLPGRCTPMSLDWLALLVQAPADDRVHHLAFLFEGWLDKHPPTDGLTPHEAARALYLLARANPKRLVEPEGNLSLPADVRRAQREFLDAQRTAPQPPLQGHYPLNAKARRKLGVDASEWYEAAGKAGRGLHYQVVLPAVALAPPKKWPFEARELGERTLLEVVRQFPYRMPIPHDHVVLAWNLLRNYIHTTQQPSINLPPWPDYGIRSIDSEVQLYRALYMILGDFPGEVWGEQIQHVVKDPTDDLRWWFDSIYQVIGPQGGIAAQAIHAWHRRHRANPTDPFLMDWQRRPLTLEAYRSWVRAAGYPWNEREHP